MPLATWRKYLPARAAVWLPVALAFLFVSLSRIDDGGGNAMSRFAVMRAMADEHTFRIDHYYDWTGDWVRTPDGHYYSNKAPGPTLVAFPAFWLIDRALYNFQTAHPDELGRRQAPRGIHKVAITTLYQVIPFLVLVILALNAAYPEKIPGGAYLLGLIAILFANTGGVMMSTYMGNPFAAMAMVGVCYFYLRGHLGWASFFFGLLVMADYVEGALVFPFAALMWAERKERGFFPVARAVAIGAAVPALLWCWYHITCFGGPLNLAFKYESNPAVVPLQQSGTGALWGIISLLPNPKWVGELLFGMMRGVLFTQPWVLVCFVAPLFWRLPNARLRRCFYFLAASFLVLLWINGGFPSWEGGSSPGPRYLAAALAAAGIFLPWVFMRGGWALRSFLVAAVTICVVYRGFMYATWLLAGTEPIVTYYWRNMLGAKEWAMFAVFAAVLLAAIFQACRKISAAGGEI